MKITTLSEIPEADTYATDQIDRVTEGETIALTLRQSFAGDIESYGITVQSAHGTAEAELDITAEELAEIRAIFARRTL